MPPKIDSATAETIELPDRAQDSGPPDDLTARLSLSPGSHRAEYATPGPGPLDGAWWPRSRDLTLEVPPLIAALEPVWGRVTRVTVNPMHWPVIPKKVQLPDRVVRVGWFGPEQDPNKLLLLSYRIGRWDLLVIPPQTPYDTAVRLLAAASDPTNVRTASVLMDELGAGFVEDDTQAPLAA